MYIKIIEEVIILRDEGRLPDDYYFRNHENKEVVKLYIDFSLDQYQYADWEGRGLELQTQLPPEENQKSETDDVIMRTNFQKLLKMIDYNQQLLNNYNPESSEYLAYLRLHKKLIEQRKIYISRLNRVVN
ncbi:MAG: hypothetical protein R2771_15150 [Saprospiraceae bacterium]